MLRYTRRALKPNSIGPFHKAIGRDLSSRMKKKGEKARYTVWKNEKNSLTLKRFCENCLQFKSIIKASNSRKFCEKMVKVILRKFHTVQYHRSRNQTASRSRNFKGSSLSLELTASGASIVFELLLLFPLREVGSLIQSCYTKLFSSTSGEQQSS